MTWFGWHSVSLVSIIYSENGLKVLDSIEYSWRGAVLCRGPRTVASVLRVMGLGGERRFEKYHRVLNRARWSGLQGAKILLGLLIGILPRDWPLEIVADETIERRNGRRIQAKGRYRDAVRSTKGTVVKCYGLKWMSLMLLVPLPWSTRPWTLPFLTLLAPPERANTAAKRWLTLPATPGNRNSGRGRDANAKHPPAVV